VPDPKNFTVEILKDCLEKALTSPSEHTSKAFEADLPSSTYNKMVQQERNTLWRIQHQENDAIKKQREGAIKKQKKVKAQARKLAAKGIPANQLEATAERDAAIISGETRTKHSMG